MLRKGDYCQGMSLCVVEHWLARAEKTVPDLRLELTLAQPYSFHRSSGCLLTHTTLTP